jgi:hypothetical protein
MSGLSTHDQGKSDSASYFFRQYLDGIVWKFKISKTRYVSFIALQLEIRPRPLLLP